MIGERLSRKAWLQDLPANVSSATLRAGKVQRLQGLEGSGLWLREALWQLFDLLSLILWCFFCLCRRNLEFFFLGHFLGQLHCLQGLHDFLRFNCRLRDLLWIRQFLLLHALLDEFLLFGHMGIFHQCVFDSHCCLLHLLLFNYQLLLYFYILLFSHLFNRPFFLNHLFFNHFLFFNRFLLNFLLTHRFLFYLLNNLFLLDQSILHVYLLILLCRVFGAFTLHSWWPARNVGSIFHLGILQSIESLLAGGTLQHAIRAAAQDFLQEASRKLILGMPQWSLFKASLRFLAYLPQGRSKHCVQP
mmetsp:Transcript_45814/g.99816  ORF Transcript_45814/g.99816 Transcript_45814/m.99816 type:complete len:302 (-) Transcript_45814:555-1460(-)